MTPTPPTLDDLRRELHDQADAARAWPAPVVPHRRAAAPWRPLAVVATVLAVLALVLVPRLVRDAEQGGGGVADGPAASPTDLASPSGSPTRWQVPALRTTQDWTLEQCVGRRPTCTAPYLIRSGGIRLASHAGGQAGTRTNGERNDTLTYARRLRKQDAYVLLGARGSGPGSQLVAHVGGQVLHLQPGRLTLVVVPPDARVRGSEIVQVTEDARPLPSETLVIEEYVPVR